MSAVELMTVFPQYAYDPLAGLISILLVSALSCVFQPQVPGQPLPDELINSQRDERLFTRLVYAKASDFVSVHPCCSYVPGLRWQISSYLKAWPQPPYF
ncbi:hypothetical protein F4774DRAFT_373803 [Daldinia eschscholtzii]|nr:hypothetical protein F4774DRAFT_373803 [Daldinia eschscholtzii]